MAEHKIVISANAEQAVKGFEAVEKAARSVRKPINELTKEAADVPAILEKIGQTGPPAVAEFARSAQAAVLPVDQLQARLRELVRAEQSAANEAKKSAQAYVDSQKAMEKAGDDFHRRAMQLGATALGVGYGLAKATAPAMDFEASMRNVNSLLLLSEPEFEKLSESTRKAGEELGLAALPAEKAAALYDIVSAGFTDTAQAQELLTRAMLAGKAGLADTKTSAQTLINVVNSYGRESMTAASASDVLFQTVKEGVTTYPELASELGNVTSIAASAGISFEEVGAAIAILTQRGLKTSEAITALRGAIMELVKPSESSRQAMEAHGVVIDANSLKSKGLIQTLKELAGAANGDTTVMAQFVDSVRALNGVLTLTKDGGTGVTETLGRMKTSLGATANAADQNRRSTKAAFEHMAGDVATAAASIGSALLPALTVAAKMASGFARGLDELGPGLKGVIAWGGVLSGVILVGAKAYQTAAAGVRLLTAATALLTVEEQKNTLAAGENAVATSRLGAAAATARTGGSALMGLMGGPWGAAVIGLGLATQALISHMEHQNEVSAQALEASEKLAASMRRQRQVQIDLAGGKVSGSADQYKTAMDSAEEVLKGHIQKRRSAQEQLDALSESAKGRGLNPDDLPGVKAARAEVAAYDALIKTANEHYRRNREAYGQAQADARQAAEDAKKPAAVAASNVKREIEQFKVKASEGKLSADQQIRELERILAMEGVTADQKIELNKRLNQTRKQVGQERLQQELGEINEARSAEEISHEQAIERLKKAREIAGITATDKRKIDREIVREEKAARDEALTHELHTLDRGLKANEITAAQEIAALEKILATHKLTAQQREQIEDRLADKRKKQIEDQIAIEEKAMKKALDDGDKSLQDLAAMYERRAKQIGLDPTKKADLEEKAASTRKTIRDHERAAEKDRDDARKAADDEQLRRLNERAAAGQNVLAEQEALIRKKHETERAELQKAADEETKKYGASAAAAEALRLKLETNAQKEADEVREVGRTRLETLESVQRKIEELKAKQNGGMGTFGGGMYSASEMNKHFNIFSGEGMGGDADVSAALKGAGMSSEGALSSEIGRLRASGVQWAGGVQPGTQGTILMDNWGGNNGNQGGATRATNGEYTSTYTDQTGGSAHGTAADLKAMPRLQGVQTVTLDSAAVQALAEANARALEALAKKYPPTSNAQITDMINRTVPKP